MRRLAGVAALLLCWVAGSASAQVVRREVINPDTLRGGRRAGVGRDSLQDTTRAGRGPGIPQHPSRQFEPPDSITSALLQRRGFRITHYGADSVQLRGEDKEIRLVGRGLVEREGSSLEADSVRYVQEGCQLLARGSPRLFDPSGVLVGQGMQYDACNKTGIVEHARTDLAHGGGTWYIVGDMAVDNAEDRVYAAHAAITSCLLEEPHYHFQTRQVKWINKRLMVSRPAVLYVADVPVAWLPFVFQDTRRGRRSGILPPQVGINDIVRFNSGYQRHIANVGYYWVVNDYMDAQASLDWYASRSMSLNGRFRYRWLDRFMAGGIAVRQLREFSGRSSFGIDWSHQQQFSLNSQLTASVQYATSSQVISQNAVDPILSIGTLDSRVNYQRRFQWGSLNIGGSRTQSLDKPQVTMTAPSVSFTPTPIRLSRAITWSPALSFTNSLQSRVAGAVIDVAPGQRDTLLNDSRNSSLSLSTPIRIGAWTWQNSMSVSDAWSNRRLIITDTATGTTTTYAETFQTGVDWQTGIGLPVLFQGNWNLQPGLQIVNTAGGPFLLRNNSTGGAYVAQSKRLQFSAAVSPTFFGLFPGFGPVSRIRHAISPSLGWAYSPAATIPQAYADATAQGLGNANRNIPARQSLSLGLSQIIEAKLRPPPRPAGDTSQSATGEQPEGRKIKLLSIQSDGITYDFEQAKLPGRNGWTTQTWGSTLSSDLVRGLSVRLQSDLWDGPVGYDTTAFSPYLTSVTTGFSIGAGSLNLLRRVLGLGVPAAGPRPTTDTLANTTSPLAPGPTSTAFQRGNLASAYSSVDRLGVHTGGPFQASLSYSLQRSRPAKTTATGPVIAPNPGNSMLTGQMSFSPTEHWSVAWQTSYNFTQGTFGQHVVRLDRDLHDWRATFTFIRSPNGNFSFSFYIALIAEPDLKFDYDQRSYSSP
jgi:lipopolysaccharide transport LptD-like protein